MLRLPQTHPAVNGSGLAAFHAERAAFYRAEQARAIQRGDFVSAGAFGQYRRKHATLTHACHKAVEGCL
jgi:hypothetical protein